MNTIRIGFAKIEATGITKTIKYSALVFLSTAASAIIGTLSHQDFGTSGSAMGMLAPTAIALATTFCRYYFGSYSVPFDASSSQE